MRASERPEFEEFLAGLPRTYHGYTFKTVLYESQLSMVFLVQSVTYEDTTFAAKVTSKAETSGIRDIEILRHLVHTNIVKIYDIFESDEFFFIVTEYCSKGTMADLIRSGRVLQTKEKLAFYMYNMIRGLLYCHERGIAHRDIKPQNIVIDDYGRPKWIDFTLSLKCAPGEEIEVFSGSGPYRAPELILETPHDPFRADVWSLGVTFFEMATGTLPWPKSARKNMEKTICQGLYSFPMGTTSPCVKKLIESMLTPDPHERPTLKALLRSGIFKSFSDNDNTGLKSVGVRGSGIAASKSAGLSLRYAAKRLVLDKFLSAGNDIDVDTSSLRNPSLRRGSCCRIENPDLLLS